MTGRTAEPVIVPRVARLRATPPQHPDAEADLGPSRPLRSLHLNESPSPPSSAVVAAMQRAAAGLNRYPDHDGLALIDILAGRTGIPAPRIVIGAGSNELLYASADVALDPAAEGLAPAPGFPTYAKTISLRGARFVPIPTRPDGVVDVDATLAAVTERTRLVFVASPQNPTGGLMTADEIERLALGLPEGVLLHFDEAYYEFGRHAGGPDALPILARRSGPWIATRSFSKAFGLAGARLGYGFCSSVDLANAYRTIRINFSVNAVALAGAVVAVADEAAHVRPAGAECTGTRASRGAPARSRRRGAAERRELRQLRGAAPGRGGGGSAEGAEHSHPAVPVARYAGRGPHHDRRSRGHGGRGRCAPNSASAGMSLRERLQAIVGETGLLTEAPDLVGYRGDLACPAGGVILGVVRPRTTAEVAAVVRACAAADIPITPRGGGSGLAGGATPGERASVVLSFERMRRILSVDTVDDAMVVEAGCTLAEAQDTAARAGRLLGLDHGGAGSSQIGGNLATNAGGNNVLRFGMAREQVLGLEVVLADGTVLSDLSPLRKNNSGPDLKQLFLGSEGTLGLITAATLRLRPAPVVRATLCLGVASPTAAVACLGRARAIFGEMISAFELLPRSGLDLHFRHVGEAREPFDPPSPWAILVEADSPSPHVALDAAAEAFVAAALADGLVSAGTIAAGGAQRAALWRIREGIAIAMIDTAGSLKSDTAVPISKVAQFVEQAGAAVARIAPGAIPVPFGHIGDGNVHFNVLPPPDGEPCTFALLHPILAAVIEDVSIALGGTVSAEHGIGSLKRGALARMHPQARLRTLAILKATLDPAGTLNPGKIVGIPANSPRSCGDSAAQGATTIP